MSFIKLTTMAINSAKINWITIKETGYCIQMTSDKIDGFFLFTSGFINSKPDQIEICKVNHPVDYKTVSDWLNKN
jgi:hypothetical protein